MKMTAAVEISFTRSLMSRIKSHFDRLLNKDDYAIDGEEETSQTSKIKHDPSLVAYVLVILFASCSWINVNCVWTELSPMVVQLPESWGLPAYLTVIVQLAIVAPIIYGLFKKTCLKTRSWDTSTLIMFMIIVETIVTLLLAFFWHETTWIAGVKRSAALMILFFVFCLVDSTSNLVFLPYMSLYKPIYVTAYFIGMAVSGLVPSVVGLIQGAGQIKCIFLNNSQTNVTEYNAQYIEPLFAVKHFYIIMFFWMLLALFAFIILHWTKYGQQERMQHIINNNEEDDFSKPADNGNEEEPLLLSNWKYIGLLFITGWVCALSNGVLPSIQSYASLTYGQNTFHLAVILPNLAAPIVSFIPNWYHLTSVPLTCFLTIVGSAFSSYLIYLAVISPSAVLQYSMFGSISCVSVWIFVKALLTYTRAAIADSLIRSKGDRESRLFWIGVATQLGSFIGAIIIFPLVNIYSVFKSAPYC